jgi:hypothetical protein
MFAVEPQMQCIQGNNIYICVCVYTYIHIYIYIYQCNDDIKKHSALRVNICADRFYKEVKKNSDNNKIIFDNLKR